VLKTIFPFSVIIENATLPRSPDDGVALPSIDQGCAGLHGTIGNHFGVCKRFAQFVGLRLDPMFDPLHKIRVDSDNKR
jgi:hypothetical protein